jgi:Tol biopolymer transport system component
MKRYLAAWSASALFCAAAVSAQAQCVTSLASGASPITTGHLAFQGVVSDTESYVYVYDFKHRTFADTTHWTTVVDAHNPSLTQDGKWIVFMARPALNQPMRIWAWNSSLAEPVDLTTLSGGNTSVYNEDPKFAFDSGHIVFKQNGAIAIMSVSGLNGTISVGAPSVLASGLRGTSTEASGPVLAAKNNLVYFFRDVSPDEHLERLTLDDFTTVKDVSYASPSGTETYYPSLAKDGTLYFARHTVSPTGMDSIYTVAPHQNVNSATPVASNLCGVENADPAPDGAGDLVFSSTFAGRYQLYVGDTAGDVWNFSDRPEINATSGALQGASYSPH